MKPGYLRVFDGLRITTEHLNHFQGSLHSAVQDLRAILGLGRVQAGFEVVRGEGNQVTVQPGIAFDWRRNRIVSDEPQSLDVLFPGTDDERWIVARYDQIEDGKVGDRYTMVFDGCAFEQRSTPPAPDDNVVPIARLLRRTAGGFEVQSAADLLAVASAGAPDDEGEAPASGAPVEEHAGAANGVPAQPTAVADAAALRDAFPAIAPAPPPEEQPDFVAVTAEASRPASFAMPRVDAAQGVTRLTEEELVVPLDRLVAGPLRFPPDGGALAARERRVGVARAALAPRLPESLSAQILVSGSLASGADGAPAAHRESFQLTSVAEATIGADGIAQFGVGTLVVGTSPSSSASRAPVTAIAEDHVAVLELGRALAAAGDEDAAIARMLAPLSLRIALERAASGGLDVAAFVVRQDDGGGADPPETVPAQAEVALHIQVVIAWKSLGVSSLDESKR